MSTEGQPCLSLTPSNNPAFLGRCLPLSFRAVSVKSRFLHGACACPHISPVNIDIAMSISSTLIQTLFLGVQVLERPPLCRQARRPNRELPNCSTQCAARGRILG